MLTIRTALQKSYNIPALLTLREVGSELRRFLDSLEAEPGRLEEVEAFWGDQLSAFKAHAEKRSKARKR